MMEAVRLVVLLAEVLSIGAQPQPAVPSSDVTLTGCLMPTDTGMRRPATTGATSPGERGELAKPTSGYVLKDATIVTNTTEAGDKKGTSGSALEYRLSPADRTVKLDDHLRHEVEIRGHLVNPEQATDPKKGLTPDRADTAHTVTVTSVRTLARTCGPASAPVSSVRQ
jgi:hypothetical protein